MMNIVARELLLVLIFFDKGAIQPASQNKKKTPGGNFRLYLSALHDQMLTNTDGAVLDVIKYYIPKLTFGVIFIKHQNLPHTRIL